ITYCGDGTTLKNVTYESQSANIKDAEGKHIQYSLGIHSAVNHRSETQLAGLEERLESMFDTYNRYQQLQTTSSSPAPATAKPQMFFLKLEGSMTDHAADQKYLDALFEEAKQDTTNALGGLEVWNVLSAAAQKEKKEKVYHDLCHQLGEDDFCQMPLADQKELLRFIAAGCGMHKGLTVIKAGNAALMLWWDQNRLTGPIKLMNKDNKAAAKIGNDAAKQRAEDVSCGGGAKLWDIAGNILRNKDPKKGHQDAFKNWCICHFGYSITFADTSNTQFQSHYDAACDLLINTSHYIDYLKDYKDKKDNCTYTNMEYNFLLGLQDIPIIEELCGLALYGQAVSVSYMRVIQHPMWVIWHPMHEVNALDLCGIHSQVSAFLAKVAADPEILLSPTTDFMTLIVDGQHWAHPEVVF
ncbi:hypothetical protein M422DRAFT_169589, partial [Sphaerobolus stellatus SS14]